MTERERFIIALKREPIAGRCTAFELMNRIRCEKGIYGRTAL